jgi:hypothetical protein
MESMRIILTVILLVSSITYARVRKKTVVYYKKTYGHIHELANKYSPSLTTIACGHPMAFIREKEDKVGKLWVKVVASNIKGYVDLKHISKTRPVCPQRLYPKFWNSLNMDVSELYYWGRLYDQFIEGNSNIR